MTKAEAAIAFADEMVRTRLRSPPGGHSRLLLDYIDAACRGEAEVTGIRRVLTRVRELRAETRHPKSNLAVHRGGGRVEAYDKVIQLLAAELAR